MASKVGTLIKEARTAADLTQEELARKISGLSAADISKAERGEKTLTQEQLKKIAKITGVTQASLLNASRKTTSTTKTSAKKTTAAKSSGTSMKLTAAEKKLMEAYRAAGSDERKAALRVLQGDCPELLTSLLGSGSSAADGVADLIGDAIGKMLGK